MCMFVLFNDKHIFSYFYKIFTKKHKFICFSPQNGFNFEDMIFFSYTYFLAYKSIPEYKFSENVLVLFKNYKIINENY